MGTSFCMTEADMWRSSSWVGKDTESCSLFVNAAFVHWLCLFFFFCYWIPRQDRSCWTSTWENQKSPWDRFSRGQGRRRRASSSSTSSTRSAPGEEAGVEAKGGVSASAWWALVFPRLATLILLYCANSQPLEQSTFAPRYIHPFCRGSILGQSNYNVPHRLWQLIAWGMSFFSSPLLPLPFNYNYIPYRMSF